MKRTDGSTGFRISTLEDAPGVAWVAGDEQTVFLPGARHFQCPLPSELLLLILCREASGLRFVCLFRESLGVFLFPPSSQHGIKTNYPLSLTLGHWREVKD